MTEFADIVHAIKVGDHQASEALLPLVYDELRNLAAAKLAQEGPGQTLQPTALVHEAYLRLIGDGDANNWEGRQHFFAAAAEAMRRILIDRARHKAAVKRGGDLRRVDLSDHLIIDDQRADELVALDEALNELERHDAAAAQLVKLRYFAGLGHQEAAEALGISRRAADRCRCQSLAFPDAVGVSRSDR
jgi:RNA polymerase sigma factor (TIGR02999 family)